MDGFLVGQEIQNSKNARNLFLGQLHEKKAHVFKRKLLWPFSPSILGASYGQSQAVLWKYDGVQTSEENGYY